MPEYLDPTIVSSASTCDCRSAELLERMTPNSGWEGGSRIPSLGPSGPCQVFGETTGRGRHGKQLGQSEVLHACGLFIIAHLTLREYRRSVSHISPRCMEDHAAFMKSVTQLENQTASKDAA